MALSPDFRGTRLPPQTAEAFCSAEIREFAAGDYQEAASLEISVNPALGPARISIQEGQITPLWTEDFEWPESSFPFYANH